MSMVAKISSALNGSSHLAHFLLGKERHVGVARLV